MFSTIVSVGTTSSSWAIIEMPACRAASGIAELDRDAVELDPARVRAQPAAEHVDDGALAGTVLAHERMNLARAQVEVDPVQNLDPVEALAQARGRASGRRRPRRPFPPPFGFPRVETARGGGEGGPE